MQELTDKRILVTGPAGQIAFPLVERLAADNEVWGIARFSGEGSRERVEAVGCTTRVVDLTDPNWTELPERFDHVLHLAIFQSPAPDYEQALRVNCEGTAMLMARFADADSFLDVSTIAVYDRHPDPAHLYVEDDPIGETKQVYSATYSITKIAQEAVVRSMSRVLGLPSTIARMNASYGPNGGLPAYQLDMIVNDVAVPVRTGGCWFNPIHDDDIVDQVPKLLSVASVPATIVNWSGDDAVETVEYCDFLGSLVGRTPTYQFLDDGMRGTAVDTTRRRSLIGDCSVKWQDGFRDMARRRHPEHFVGD